MLLTRSVFKVLAAALAAVSTGLTQSVAADPWIDPGNSRIRHHIQTLSDAGLVGIPITSWPLMWSSLKGELDEVNHQQLNPKTLWSYRYLKHELRKAQEKFNFVQDYYGSNALNVLGDFSDTSREEIEASLALTYTGARTAFRLKANYVHEPADDGTVRADGSYASFLAGNWAFGVGAIDRWWGPGWQSSMILSHNARPTPGIFLQRNLSEPFALPVLEWLGPWQLTTFMNVLEEDRHIPHARLWGMRFNFRPIQTLEIGLSRTAQWAGDGRPGDLDTFFDLLIGRDNRGSDGIDADASNEPGNQLAGVDLRWSPRFMPWNAAVYTQLIGEDEAGGMPSRHIGMAGLEFASLLGDVHARFNFELHNSMVYFYETDKRRGNVAYEHSIYRSGYRYFGRAIGASTDNDTEAFSLKSQFYLRNGHNIRLDYSHLRLNYDDSSASPPGGSGFGANANNVDKLSFNYTAPLTRSLEVELGVFHYTAAIVFEGNKIDSGGHIRLHAYW